MNTRERLENQILLFGLAQLDFYVKRSLQEDREVFVIEQNLKIIVSKLLDELERQEKKLIRFLLFLRETLHRPELRTAINDYLNELLGIQTPNQDPYNALVVFGEPFVDRQELRLKLRDLFSNNMYQVLVTRGPRYSGRSHSRWLIKHVAKAINVKVVTIDLLELNIDEMINKLINEMRLPVTDFRDRMAQNSTQIKGFISALKGYATKEFINNAEQWCVIFDNHDKNEVLPDARQFVELLIKNAVEAELPNISIIVLGLGITIKPEIFYQVLDVPTIPLEPHDVVNFLSSYANQNGQIINSNDIESRKEIVLDALDIPLNLDGMFTVCNRLRNYIN